MKTIMQSPVDFLMEHLEPFISKPEGMSDAHFNKWSKSVVTMARDMEKMNLAEKLTDAEKSVGFSRDYDRYEKLKMIAKLLAKSWYLGNWKWETLNERAQEMLMRELGYYPFVDESDMISKTHVDEDLFQKAINKVL